MLPRFCQLCYQTVDESFIKLRKFSVKYTPSIEFELAEDEAQVLGELKYMNNEEVRNDDSEQSIKKPKRRCIIKCKRSNFDYYEGDTFSKFQPMPLVSRFWRNRKYTGDYFTIYPPKITSKEPIDDSSSFREINIDPGLLHNLEDNGIIKPTPIQKLGIPPILAGQNAILTADPGCGKTFAFLIPLLHQILQWKRLKERGYNRPLGLILTPSRELIHQISKVAKQLSKNLNINITTLVGGRTQKMLENPPVCEVDLVIATLGVINKLVGTNVYKMNEVKHVVIDEADTMFDKSFKGLLSNFLKKVPISSERDPNESYPSTAQLTLNSATIPENIYDTLHTILDTTSLIPITTGQEHQINVPQKFFRLNGTQKSEMLLKLVKKKVKSKIPIIVFSNTTQTCDFTTLFLKNYNIRAINLHGDMSMDLRKGRYMEFLSGRCNILTTTDSGARGLDTTVAKDVINFDFPLITSEYIHRCGRIGRIGSPKDCIVYNFICRPLEIILTNKIEYAIRKNKAIPMVDLIHNPLGKEDEFLGTRSFDEHYTTVPQETEDPTPDEQGEERALNIPQ